jgi:hypothetical protein
MKKRMERIFLLPSTFANAVFEASSSRILEKIVTDETCTKIVNNVL